jgi:hypothetical protein
VLHEATGYARPKGFRKGVTKELGSTSPEWMKPGRLTATATTYARDVRK